MIIGEAGAMTLNVNVDSNADNLTIETNGTLQYTSNNITLTVNGNLTMNGAAAVTTTNNTDNRVFTVNGTFNIGATATASIEGIQVNVIGATTLDGGLTLNNNAGVKTFQSLVALNAGGAWTSTVVTTAGRLIFQNGITNNGTSFAAGDATFDTNDQSISGTTSVSFSNDVNVTGVTLTNDLASPDELSIALDLQGTGGFTQGTNAILNIGDDVLITTLTASANPNTVVYNGTAGADVACPVASTYHHLTIDKTAVVNVNMSCSTTINGDLTINGGTLRSDLNAGALTHTVSGSTSINSGSSAGTYNIRDNASVLNLQDLILDGATIIGGDATSNINVATTFNTTGTSSTINACNFDVTGATTIDAPIVFGNNNGVKTFRSAVTINAGGSWTSTSVTTNDNMVFQNGITSDGSSFAGGDATFNTNAQSISGGTSVSFSRDVTVNGITITNNLVSPDELTITQDLQGTGGLTQGVNSILNIGDDATISTLTANASPNLVNYNTAAGSTMVCPTSNTYHHLTIDKTAVVISTLPCSLTINGDLNILGGTLRSDLNASAFTHTVNGSTSISSSSSTATYNIRFNSTVLNVQDLSMDGATIDGGDATGGVNVATTFTTSGASSSIQALNFNVTGTTTLDAPLVLGDNTGVKTFQDLVEINAGASWTSDIITTADRLIFQNGITNDGSSFSAGVATFNTNAQSIDGSTTLTFNADVVSTGVVVTNNATVEMTDVGTATLSGTGTWSQGTGTLEYAGQTLTIATFNASNSGNTVDYNQAGVQAVIVPSDGSYYNLILSNAGTKTPDASLDVDNNLTIGGTATLDVNTNSADLTIGGDWDNSGTGFTQGTQTVTFNGALAAQSIGGTNSTDFYNLVLNNTFGSSPEFTLGLNTTAQNQLTMTSGNVNLSTFTLTLGTAAATPGALVYTSGDLFNGSFLRYFDAVTLSDGNVAGLFPMGDTFGNSRPFYVSPATAPGVGGTITASITSSESASDIGPIDDNGTDIVRQHSASWNITTGGGLTGGDNYNIRGGGSGFGEIAAVSDLRLMIGGGIVGTDGGAGGSTGFPIVDRTGLTLAQLSNSFHLGSIDDIDSPLPIVLASFEAEYKIDHVEISWVTASEINNDFFSIERSSDGINFYEITQVEGAGQSSEKLSYSYTDFNPLNGESFYRLRQTDFDGKTEIFTPVKVKQQQISSISLYPNPLNGNHFSIQFNQKTDQPVLIDIFDNVGKRIHFQTFESKDSIVVSFVGGLKPGVYLVVVQNGSTQYNQRLLVR